LNRETFIQNIQPYVPNGAADMVFDLIKEDKLKLKITKTRKTKFGDYRTPYKVDYHTISVNGTLNQQAFLITLIHEIAHLKVHVNFSKKVAPHGSEWKNTFKSIMLPFLNPNMFPDEVLRPLANYMKNPKASTTSDLKLYAALKQLNKEDSSPMVSDLDLGTLFLYKDSKFEKGLKRRTRIICYKMPSRKPYLFSPLTEVNIIKI